MRTHSISFLMLLFLGIYILAGSAHAGGFAAGPSKVYFNKVLRGGYAQQEIYLYNPEEIITDIEISAEGPFADWIFFNQGKKFSIPAKGSYRLKTYIEPPADIANGVYNGTIYAVSKPRRIPVIEGHGLAIETAISLIVFADITGEQIIKYEVKSMSAENAEEGEPIRFSFTGMNMGNVRTKPSINIDIYNGDKSAFVKRESATMDETLPTTEKTYTLNVSSKDLNVGQYWANISVLAAGNIAGNNLVTFDIAKKGSLARNGELVQVIVNKPWAKTGEVVRIDPVFKNTGQAPTDAKFKGEVYIGDTIIDTIESEEINVLQGESANLTTYYAPKRQGIYTIKGVAHYSGKITYEKGTVINVEPPGGLAEDKNALEQRQIIAGLGIIVLLTIMYLAHSNRKDRASKYESVKNVSGRLDNVESSLDKMTIEAKRMSTKIQRLKSRMQ